LTTRLAKEFCPKSSGVNQGMAAWGMPYAAIFSKGRMIKMNNDNVQPGILEDTPAADVNKGAALGGLGGAAVGAAAGSLIGPVGTVIGAVAGGLMGAGASGAAVAAVEQVEHNDSGPSNIRASSNDTVVDTDIGGHNAVTGGPAVTEAGNTGLASGAVVGGLLGTAVAGPLGAVVGGTVGSLLGGVAGDAAEASADDSSRAEAANYSGSAFQAEAAMDAGVTPLPSNATRPNDDVLSPSSQTDYRSVDNGRTSVGSTDLDADMAPMGGLSTPGVRIGDDVPGVQTGGVTTQGPDTRGLTEKGADALTGDDRDGKTGGRVLNDPANGGTLR
jgi:phage tail tape-measure protein